VMNEVDRMSNPEAGDPPIGDRWRSLPRLESSDTWWGLFLLGALTTAVGSNWLPYADVKSAGYATALVLVACGMAATAGSGFAAGRMVRIIGDRLPEPVPMAFGAAVPSTDQGAASAWPATEREWIRGYEWAGYEEQTVRCLSCRKDVSFPAGLKRHGSHKIAVPAGDGTLGRPPTESLNPDE